ADRRPRAPRAAGRAGPRTCRALHARRHGRRLPRRLRGPGPGACRAGDSSAAGRGGRGRLMKFVLFYHSLVSDWNHGNAHFLRGVAAELQARGHAVDVYEPEGGWSRTQMLAEGGPEAEAAYAAH